MLQKKPKPDRFDLQQCLKGIHGLNEITLDGIQRWFPIAYELPDAEEST